MNPAVIFLISEAVKVVIQKINEQGKLGTLTDAEAQLMIQNIALSLDVNLPTPSELEGPVD